MAKSMTTATAGGVKEMRMQEALREALRYEMARAAAQSALGRCHDS